MDDLIICTRISLDNSVSCQSHAGLSIRAQDHKVHSFLFSNLDPNISIQVLGEGDRHEFLAVFHLFLGAYLKSLTVRDVEFFRFHGETWPSYLFPEDEPDTIGEEIHRSTGPNRTSRHTFEHLGGLYLTDPMHLSAHMQAGAPTTKVHSSHTPDPNAYRATYDFMPHPGLIVPGEEGAGMESYLRYQKSLEHRYVM